MAVVCESPLIYVLEDTKCAEKSDLIKNKKQTLVRTILQDSHLLPTPTDVNLGFSANRYLLSTANVTGYITLASAN